MLQKHKKQHNPTNYIPQERSEMKTTLMQQTMKESGNQHNHGRIVSIETNRDWDQTLPLKMHEKGRQESAE